MRICWTFHSVGELRFGLGALNELGECCARRGLQRVFIATDRTLVSVGLSARVEEVLRRSNIESHVFDGGQPEPTYTAVHAGLAAATFFQPDAILGLGGGSNLDLAKSVALLLRHGGHLTDFVGEDRVPGPVLPLICIPTTAGTGSEVSASCVLTDVDQQVKVGIVSQHLRPTLALVDPQLTVTCPRKVTADSGIDALTHAIEAFTAVDYEKFPLPPGEVSLYQGRHPLGDALAEKAIALCGQWLVCAANEPQNLAAREAMSAAATLAGLAFSNVGVALVHAMEYPVGGAVHCTHGEGNGLLLPHVMRYNLAERKSRFARVAQLLGEDVAGLDEDAAAERAIAAVQSLLERLWLRTRLSELGVREEQVMDLAVKAFAIKRILRVNPRAPAGPDEIAAIYRAAL